MTGALNPIRIRRAAPHDVPELGSMGAALLAIHHGFDAKRYMAPSAGTAQGYGSYLATQVEDPDAILLVAQMASDRAATGPPGSLAPSPGAILGYAFATLEGPDYMTFRGPAGVFQDLFVKPEVRRNGVGAQLFDAILEEIGRQAPRVVLSIAAQNEAARRLAESRGFRPTLTEMTRDA